MDPLPAGSAVVLRTRAWVVGRERGPVTALAAGTASNPNELLQSVAGIGVLTLRWHRRPMSLSEGASQALLQRASFYDSSGECSAVPTSTERLKILNGRRSAAAYK